MRSIFVIYKNPTDFPNVAFVMREHHIKRGKLVPGDRTWQGSDVGRVRRFIPKGMTKMERHERDEPQICEWWY